jgi:hypothetical protein
MVHCRAGSPEAGDTTPDGACSVSVPKNLSAFIGKGEDYEWTPVPAKPAATVLPTMKISSEPISYEELAANLRRYADELVKVPDWQTLLEEKNQAAKLAKRDARRAQRRKAA